jgi:hypothetical protein
VCHDFCSAPIAASRALSSAVVESAGMSKYVVHANSFLGSDVRRVEIHYCVGREHMCMLEEDLIKWYRPKWND